MSEPESIMFSGVPASPYTRKMLSVLRYRRIPYRFITRGEASARGLPEAKVPLMPTFYLPGTDGEIEARCDSSPLIRRFETEHSGRNVVPADPVIALIDMLLEDYGDEWLTKPLFHYRWTCADDIKRAGDVLPFAFEGGLSRPDDEVAVQADRFRKRQIDRLWVVGSTPQTGAVIEQSYVRFLDVLNAHLRAFPFVMGHRPGASDFAIFGQFTQLVQFDPTSMAIALERAPRLYTWTTVLDDLAGAEPSDQDWIRATAIPPSLKAILSEAGRTYAPVMQANAQALADGSAEFEVELDGVSWRQKPFPYHGKCVRWLREAYDALAEADRAAADEIFAGTGCEVLFAE